MAGSTRWNISPGPGSSRASKAAIPKGLSNQLEVSQNIRVTGSRDWLGQSGDSGCNKGNESEIDREAHYSMTIGFVWTKES